jgi:ariadne-1
MKCTNKGCKYEFCWVCMGPWSEHGSLYYNCNKFKQAGTPESFADPAAAAQAELNKYLFFYGRYMNHDQSGKIAVRQRGELQRKLESLQQSGGYSYSDVSFLHDASEALLECRRVLKYTYVYGFYFRDVINKAGAAAGAGAGAGSGGGSSAAQPGSAGGGLYLNITPGERTLFEHLQEQLERSTEHLHGLTERPVDKMDRTEISNFTRVTMQFLRNLLSGVEDGLIAV